MGEEFGEAFAEPRGDGHPGSEHPSYHPQGRPSNFDASPADSSVLSVQAAGLQHKKAGQPVSVSVSFQHRSRPFRQDRDGQPLRRPAADERR